MCVAQHSLFGWGGRAVGIFYFCASYHGEQCRISGFFTAGMLSSFLTNMVAIGLLPLEEFLLIQPLDMTFHLKWLTTCIFHSRSFYFVTHSRIERFVSRVNTLGGVCIGKSPENGAKFTCSAAVYSIALIN